MAHQLTLFIHRMDITGLYVPAKELTNWSIRTSLTASSSTIYLHERPPKINFTRLNNESAVS